MPGVTAGLISQTWVDTSPMRWMPGASRMLAGVVITRYQNNT